VIIPTWIVLATGSNPGAAAGCLADPEVPPVAVVAVLEDGLVVPPQPAARMAITEATVTSLAGLRYVLCRMVPPFVVGQ
jgi:hypothetical protein